MNKYIYVLLLVLVFASCAADTATETATSSTVAFFEPLHLSPLPETTEVIITTVETTEITTIETTVETTTEVTTEATTEATTATEVQTTVTTAAPKPPSKPKYSAHVLSVLEGEYAYGGEPIIENIDGITYVNGILIANKTYPLPESFDPHGLNPVLNEAFEIMKADAAADGITLKIVSGYRSYKDQINAYTKFSNRDGKEAADRYSARPGHSEHQTGLAIDLNSVQNSFANTPAGKWLAENCVRYGFIIRYPEGKEHITGYMYEPWHVRYVGVEMAEMISESGLCLEEFLGITSVYSE